MQEGCGKVILLGEHGVVYGRPALAASIGSGATAEASAFGSNCLEVEPWGVRLELPPPLSSVPHSLERAFEAVLNTYAERPRVRVQARVSLPAGAGLGCSAALGVAVIRAIDAHVGVTRSPAEVAEASLVWERVFHGNPSGVDSWMAAGAGLALYRKQRPLEAVKAERPLPLVIANSNEPSSTATMVDGVANRREDDEVGVEALFDDIAELVLKGRTAVEAGDLPLLGSLFDDNAALLCALGLETQKLESLCTAARSAGALGAKLTGAGGGGCMIALVADSAAGEAVMAALRECGVEPFYTEAS